MAPHVDLLALCHKLWGIFGILAGASLGVLAAGTEASSLQLGSIGVAETAAVWILVITAVFLIAFGALSFFAGRGLSQRKPGSRALAFALGAADLIALPLGTALGVYTFWVLMNDDARREFGAEHRIKVYGRSD